MKTTRLKLAVFATMLAIAGTSVMSCSKDDASPNPDNSGNPNTPPPGNPTAKFNAPENLIVTIVETDYEPGDDDVYVDYHVKNKSKTQSYNINDSEWDILFKVKATDGYEFSGRVNVLSIEAESDYDHGLPIEVSTGKTVDLETLSFEIVPDNGE